MIKNKKCMLCLVGRTCDLTVYSTRLCRWSTFPTPP